MFCIKDDSNYYFCGYLVNDGLFYTSFSSLDNPKVKKYKYRKNAEKACAAIQKQYCAKVVEIKDKETKTNGK